MEYKLVDYWGSGHVDVMLGNKLLAEIDTSNTGLALHFSVTIKRSNMAALEQWIQESIPAMVFLLSRANRR